MRLVIILTAVLLAGTGCVFRIDDWGSSAFNVAGLSIEKDGDVITVDGVELHHHRLVDVTAERGGETDLFFYTGTGDIELGPSESGGYALQVELWSEVEGDGEVSIEGGRLATHSPGGHTLFVNGITGVVPDGLDLRIDSGLGDVSLAGFAGGQDLHVEAGMGGASVTGCTIGTVDVDAGMGSVTLKGVNGRAAVVDAGMGSAEIEACTVGRLEADCGMGSLTIRSSAVESLEADVGMGSMRVLDCAVGALAADVGMGDLVLRGTARPEAFEVDVGLGSLHIED